ncbi:MFS transporter [Paracoccaceae bacterium GXU_MW_L88]
MQISKPATGFFPVIKLALCNGLGISSAVISVTAAALVARQVGWGGAMATVPYGMQFLALLLATYPSAQLMKRFGRKPIFLIAALCGVIGGLLGFLAVKTADPLILCLAHIALGINLANANFYRFAALEVAHPAKRASAMSLVVFGGTFAAIVGPILSRKPIFSPDLFISAYLGIAALSFAIVLLIGTTHLPRAEKAPAKFGGAEIKAALKVPQIALGMAFAAVGYGAMNLLMIASSLTLDHLGCLYTEISVTIQWHVLAMFLPSLVMGRIIANIGGLTVTLAGAILLIASCIVSALNPLSIPVIKLCLIALGVGWNMTYVGGSYLVGANAPEEHALSVQAINDVSIGVFAMLGAFLPGLITATMGWAGANLLVVAIILPVALAGAVVMRKKPASEPANTAIASHGR